jgi:hypothetical protein
MALTTSKNGSVAAIRNACAYPETEYLQRFPNYRTPTDASVESSCDLVLDDRGHWSEHAMIV